MDIQKLTASIQTHEGLRLMAYTDTTGNVTIGYGRNLTGKGISNDEANYLLSNDINTATEAAQSMACWSNVSDNDARSRAIVEMVYNLGLRGFGTFTNAIGCLLNNDFSGAADAFMASQWASQVGNRAAILTQMIATGNDP